jgi:hypothetical protein
LVGGRVFHFGRNMGRLAAVAALLGGAAGWSQYPGQVTKKSKDTPELRAVAVLEWTGEAGKPKACRLVPITVFDGEKLQDGGIYMARPEPLSLAGEVEYELKDNGKTFGLFDIKNAGQEQGSWVGYGDWKGLPTPKAPTVVPEKVDVEDDDKPVLHRKKHPGEAPDKPGSTTSTDSSSSAPSAPSDPDRPTLHKKTDDSSASSGSGGSGSNGPVLHKKTDDSDSASSGQASEPSDPDRPVLKKPKAKPPEDTAHVDALADVDDPDRPRLKRGKSSGSGSALVPTLMGLPPDMQQTVAVSDAKSHPDHPWAYSWSSPEDEAKMKAALEDIARTALGLTAAAAKPAPRRTTSAAGVRKPAKAATPAAPVPLTDEQFRVFELTYGSGATMVLSAHTDGPAASMRFVTIIAQPDLYGNVQVLLKSVTDGGHLDETPRMRLVDAVDALADNRGELLFELRGDTSRQFALYRVLRGTADKLFVSGGGFYGKMSSE